LVGALAEPNSVRENFLRILTCAMRIFLLPRRHGKGAH
jgi:hypothetical protein